MHRNVTVICYRTGRALGTAPVPPDVADAYEAGKLACCQWPEGIAAASDLLDGEVLESLGLSNDETLYLEIDR